MSELDDLEAEMARTQAAQARVNAHTRDQLLAQADPEQYSNAVRTDKLHDTPLLHDWLLDLEGNVIDLLHPDDQERFRASQ